METSSFGEDAPVGSSRARANEVHRNRLVRTILEAGLPVAQIVAPAGYGKSVLARQVMADKRFRRVLWVDCGDCESGLLHLFHTILNALGATLSSPVSRSLLLPHIGEADVRQALAEALDAFVSNASCLVLDNIPESADCEGLRFVTSHFRTSQDVGSLLVLTSRWGLLEHIDGYDGSILIDREALLLSYEEALQIVRAGGVSTGAEDITTLIFTLAGGQAALTSLLARYAARGSIERAARGEYMGADLRALLQRLAGEQLDGSQIDTLLLASVLRTGRVSELCEALPGRGPDTILAVAEAIPLVRLRGGPVAAASFEVHDLAVTAFLSEFLCDRVREPREIIARGIQLLAARGDHERAVRVLISVEDWESLARLLEAAAAPLLARGSAQLLLDAFAALGSKALLGSPRLLLAHAQGLREVGDFGEAALKATVARDLATYDGDSKLRADATLLLARIHLDRADFQAVADSLQDVVRMPDRLLSDDDWILAHTYLAGSLASIGEWDAAQPYIALVRRWLAEGCVSAGVQASASGTLGVIIGLILGDWAAVAELLLVADSLGGVIPASMRACVHSNRAYALMELGRLEHARVLLGEVRGRGSHMTLEASIVSNSAAVEASFGDYRRADEIIAESILVSRAHDDSCELSASLACQAVWTRAAGNAASALGYAEQSLEACAGRRIIPHEWLAVLEIAASLLALNDAHAAVQRARGVREEASRIGALYTMLRADMILAEAARREGNLEEAVECLRRHEDYILTESSNWQVGMYIRGFPHLLGLLAEAIDPDQIPAHLLRMVLPQDAERILRAAREVASPDRWNRLATRIVGAEAAARLARDACAPPCEVRLFGGLEVRVGEREVAERAWRKRKARLLFAVLALEGGRDVPRERICEHFWPEMDPERARNNFYVAWSAMKAALLGSSDKATPLPYAENVRGVCRASARLVHTDVAEFERHLAEAKVCEARSDSEGALRHLARIAEVYRGDLLPGDVYDDWFAPMRDRYRQEFADAMRRAAALELDGGDALRGLYFARKGLAVDPWREDLYQAALRCHIAVGQRSAAIDTYFACRSKLAEDLGIDPSSETVRLYEQVLAMEADDPDPGAVEPGGATHA